MIAIVLKGTIVLAAAFVAAALLRRRSAALRHFLWTAALGALLILPALRWMPRVTVTQPVALALDAGTTVTVVGGGATVPQAQVPWIAILYGTGVLVAASRFAIGAMRMAHLVRRGVKAPDLGPDVVIAAAPMPLAWGILRPAVVLPAVAREWPEARLRSVLLHERMHHERRDLPAQAIAQAACCLFWFHPLAWMALARQRAERERACDDAVLRQGVVAPHDYAAHLMDVVRAAAERPRRWANAPAMAEGSNLEARVRALLDGTRDRRPLTAAWASVVVVAVAALLLPLAALQLRAQTGGGTLTGTVKDPSGAVVPGCTVRAKDSGGATQGSATTDSVGQYRIPGLAGGQYTLEFAMPGFTMGKAPVTLVSGAAVQADFNLRLGQMSQTVAVTGKKSGMQAAAPRATVPVRIKVGGNVQAAKLIRQPRPVYPAELQAAGVEGTVMLQAIVGKDGSVVSLKVIKSAGNQALDDAAVTSVKQWRYQPTLLNGEPVETMTTISVGFQLEQ